MNTAPAPIREWRDVDAARFFAEIAPLQQPAILRGLVRDWPAVKAAQQNGALPAYLARFDRGAEVESLIGPPAIRGRFFYSADMAGFNFERRKEPMPQALARMHQHAHDDEPPALALQSLPVDDALPGFAAENANPLLQPEIAARIWIGTAAIVAPHYDPFYNIACVVAGRRRFTLFPPDQISNLYIGPFEFTPAGAPISLVDLDAPDFARFPRYADALQNAQSAELEPGDAIFIPFLWWHSVKSLAPFNALVNYWWNPAPPSAGSPNEALAHSALVMRSMPEDQRMAWRSLFDHLVFATRGEPLAHLPPQHQGLFGAPSQPLLERLRVAVAQSLMRPKR